MHVEGFIWDPMLSVDTLPSSKTLGVDLIEFRPGIVSSVANSDWAERDWEVTRLPGGSRGCMSESGVLPSFFALVPQLHVQM